MNGQVLRQLYETYGRELFLYLYSLCNNRELAEDLMQETFVKALLSLSEEHTNMRAWLYMVARNLYYSMYRRTKKEVLWEWTLLEETTQGAQQGEETGAPPGRAKRILGQMAVQEKELLDRLIQKEEYQLLYVALSRLKPIKREVLELQYFSRIPLKQIAVILNMKPEHVRVLSHRAKQEIRKYMEEAGYEIS